MTKPYEVCKDKVRFLDHKSAMEWAKIHGGRVETDVGGCFQISTKKGLIESAMGFAKEHPIITTLIVSELCSSNKSSYNSSYKRDRELEIMMRKIEMEQENKERLRIQREKQEKERLEWEAKSNEEKLQILRSRIVNIENTSPKKSKPWNFVILDFLEMLCYDISYWLWKEKYKKELSTLRNNYNTILKALNNEKTKI